MTFRQLPVIANFMTDTAIRIIRPLLCVKQRPVQSVHSQLTGIRLFCRVTNCFLPVLLVSLPNNDYWATYRICIQVVYLRLRFTRRICRV